MERYRGNKVKILKNISVPTGNICIVQGEKGKLEFLSIGDYGKNQNIKADFLGITRELNGVPNQKIEPLTKKWVITISSQYGCGMGCKFCDVPKVGFNGNATYYDMLNQIKLGLSLHPEIKGTDRLNIHFARMGEPTWNGNVLDVAMCLKRNIYDFWTNCKTVHPVVSTMMPKSNKKLYSFLQMWLEQVKNKIYDGEAGLQLSINTTSDIIRKQTMPHAMDLKSISNMMADIIPYLENGLKGRKIALNFALTKAEVDAKKLNTLFNPKYFMVKLTPMHMTNACKSEGLLTKDGYNAYYPYKKVEEDLKNEDFDVLVFVPSIEEDESRITCGNAILSDN